MSNLSPVRTGGIVYRDRAGRVTAPIPCRSMFMSQIRAVLSTISQPRNVSNRRTALVGSRFGVFVKCA